MPSTIRDKALPAIDNARAIVANLGLRRYSLSILTRQTPNPGTQFERLPADTRLVISPTPRVRLVQVLGKHTSADVQIGLDDLAYKVGPITPAYCEADSSVHRTGTGAGTVSVDKSIPVAGVTHGSWSLLATVTTSGSPGGSAAFTYSVDGGTTTVGPQAMASTFQVPGIGLLATFSGAFVSGDTYAVTGSSGGYTPQQLRPETTSPEVNIFYELTGDEGAFLATLVRADFDRAFRATLYLRGGRLFP